VEQQLAGADVRDLRVRRAGPPARRRFRADRTVSGYEGSINLATKGFIAGTPYGFTVALRMRKMYSA
jgi:hypothetical protein